MSKRWAALPRGTRWLLGAIGAAVLALVIAWVLFVPVADWLAHHDVGSVKGPLHETALDNARDRLLTLGAGLFAAGALIFTALNFKLLQRNSEQADQWQRRTYELTEQGQVTDRYTKAIEQLGSGKLDVQIGGIYALERIARDSARDHPTVMEVLTAFIREHSHEQGPSEVRPPRSNIHAAVTVIGRRDQDRDIQPVDLSGADLTGADLTDADLSGADLSVAGFGGAVLTDVNLSGADLTDAALGGADLTSADLSSANLRRAFLLGARLTGATIFGADLGGARWPDDTPVPEGWEQDTSSGRLKRPGTDSKPAEAN